jgi:isoleucyl-tRNA synthetase
MSGDAPKAKYKDTVILPDTPFPMKGDLAKREPEILAAWDNRGLYQQIQQARAAAPLFVFHDGPPYSNGNIHYGHILNKILKDVVVKSRTMMGFRTPFVPGWDTHGLPIELAVERELGPKRSALSPAEFRAACQAFAMKWVAVQKTEFKRLGVFGDWEHPYLTLDHSYEAQIARALAKFARDGYLYRGRKPVQWCPRDRTALAEAEIEYRDHTSPSVYVRFKLVEADWQGKLDARLEGKQLALVIWTTTPWTLPANLAIVAHPSFTYLAIPNPKDPNEYLVVAKELAETFATAIQSPGAELGAIEITPAQMATLEGARYHHPFIPLPERDHATAAPVPELVTTSEAGRRRLAALERGLTTTKPGTDDIRDLVFRLWFADYVTTEAGTGLVHTAPGHGADDFKTGARLGLPPYAPLDDSARYIKGIALVTGDRTVELTGKSTDEANPIVVAHLAETGFLLNPTSDKTRHSYPHCWRCKGPIVFRATPQWFAAIDHEALRAKALAEIDATTWVPPWGHDRIYAMIANRPDWVLSRQRLWGTPIPTFYCKGCETPIADATAMEHVADIFEKEGADAWWTKSVEELVGPNVTCPSCKAGPAQFEREKDIVDVWFESGVSWLAMRGREADGKDYAQIDLYLEGSDQHRGWFHSSLLAGIGVQGKAPYKQVITHGFILDESGIPYSKSTIAKAKAEGKKTSYIEPEHVIAKSGTEMFRLWVGSIDYRTDVAYSQTILDGLGEWYRKLRNTARFLLGNLKGFDPDRDTRALATSGVDRYMLSRLDAFVTKTRAAYEAYEFHVVHRALVEFVTVDVSAFYSDVTKDRLYSDAIDSPARRAAQVVLYECLRAIATLAAPILCFTMEDIWSAMPHRKGDPDSVHLAEFPTAGKPDDALIAEFATVLAWRERVTKALEPFRAQKNKSVDALVTLKPAAGDHPTLAKYAAELADVFIVSEVALGSGGGEVEVSAHTGAKCERCWKHFARLATTPNDVCERCAQALAGVK